MGPDDLARRHADEERTKAETVLRRRRLRRGDGMPVPALLSDHPVLTVAITAVAIIALVVVAWAVLIRNDRSTVTLGGESMRPTYEHGESIPIDYDARCCERGDVVLLDASAVPEGIQTIRRVIAFGGETVTTSIDGRVLIDGEPLDEPYARRHPTRITGVPPGCGEPENGSPGCVVPEGELFVMGDHRQFSKDSRVYGPVPASAIDGVAD